MGNNVFVQQLAISSLDGVPDKNGHDLIVEDNVGESIHVHWRNMRFEMSIDDFYKFCEEIRMASEKLEKWE